MLQLIQEDLLGTGAEQGMHGRTARHGRMEARGHGHKAWHDGHLVRRQGARHGMGARNVDARLDECWMA